MVPNLLYERNLSGISGLINTGLGCFFYFSSICRPIHCISTSTIQPCSASDNGLPFGIPCHFSRQPLQHVPVACWPRNMGCPCGAPRMGVCFPSFFGSAAESRFSTICAAWSRMVSMPFSRMYALSASCSRNRMRNFDWERRSNRSRFSHSS